MSPGRKPRHIGQTRKPQTSPRAHIWSDITHLDPLLNQSCEALRDANTRCKDPSQSHQRLDTKTLRSMLLMCCLELDSTISAIRESSYVARSSSRSKHYNAPISMRTVMDSDRYLCMASPTIKRRDLSDYKKIITCKTCSYIDPKYPRLQ